MAANAKTRRLRSGAIGAVILAATVIAVLVALNSPKGLPFSTTTPVSAAFSDIGDLRVGNEVRIGQVRVGRVNEVDRSNGVALVTMQLEGDQPVYNDARATLTSRSGLGQKYVDITPGTPSTGRRAADAVIPVDRTDSQVQLLDLAGIFDPRTAAAGQQALQSLGNGVAGRGTDLHDFVGAAPTVLPDLGTVARSLSFDQGRDLTRLLGSLDDLSTRFAGRQDQIASLTRQLDTTLQAVDVDRGAALGRTLQVAPDSLRAVRSAVTDVRGPLADTRQAVTTLQPGAAALADATPDLRGVLREAPQPLAKVPGVADDAEPALGDLTDVVADARPLAPKVTEAFQSAERPLGDLAPYGPEIAKWFSYATNALSDGDQAGHWLRFTLIPAPDTVGGVVPGLRTPLTNTDAYPEPGEAPTQHESAVTGLLKGGGR